jgi:hypothetical protein
MRTKVYTVVEPDLDVYVYGSVIRAWIENLQDMVLKGEKLHLEDITSKKRIPLRLNLLRKYLREHLVACIYNSDKLIFKIEKHEI